MNKVDYKLVFGILLILIGAIFYLGQYYGYNAFDVMYFAVGLALVGISAFNKKLWALVAGIYLIYFAAAKMLVAYNPGYMKHICCAFVLFNGLVFFIIYLKKKSRLCLSIALIFLFLGLYIAFADFFRSEKIDFLALFLGFAFLVDYIVSKRHNEMGRLCLALVFGAFAFRELIEISFPIILILLGIIIVLKSISKKLRGEKNDG